jgi:hypothetical protein
MDKDLRTAKTKAAGKVARQVADKKTVRFEVHFEVSGEFEIRDVEREIHTFIDTLPACVRVTTSRGVLKSRITSKATLKGIGSEVTS